MNRWMQHSIDYANQRNYLDCLFRVYPTIPDGVREINRDLWEHIEVSFNAKDNISLINNLLKLDLFPIKDSYVAYLKRDSTAISRNPQTINRLAGRLYEIGLHEIFENCTIPKETNRQIGPMFTNWVNAGNLGIVPVSRGVFESNTENAILNASDEEMKRFASDKLGYTHSKGLDFLARFNEKYVIGEAKFLTDYGGHQTAQFNDAISTITSSSSAVKVAILDGVLYIPSKQKMHMLITDDYKNLNIMSALVLRDFLYQL